MKRNLTVGLGLMLLCAALSLTSCSALRPQIQLAEPQIVRVPGPTQYVAVPTELTEPTPHAAKPAPLCVDAEGNAVICNRQLEALCRSESEQLDSCNADKAAIATLPASEPQQ